VIFFQYSELFTRGFLRESVRGSARLSETVYLNSSSRSGFDDGAVDPVVEIVVDDDLDSLVVEGPLGVLSPKPTDGPPAGRAHLRREPEIAQGSPTPDGKSNSMLSCLETANDANHKTAR